MALAYALLSTMQVDYGLDESQIGQLQVWNTIASAAGCLVGSIVAHGFLFGVAYGSRNAIFMGMTNPAVAATQFTAFMGMSNLAISFGNYWQGFVAERMGYVTALYVDAAIALAVIALIPFLRERDETLVGERPPAGAVALLPASASN